MTKLVDLKKAVGGTRLAPNLRFDNSPPRDNKMYQISDLSNLNKPKSYPQDNNLSRYLELENIRPHQNTLARGYQKGAHFDYVLSGMSSMHAPSVTNFHTKRLSEHKVANIMKDTFSRMNNDQYVSSCPTKYDAFKSRSKSIAHGKAVFTNNTMAVSPSGGIQDRSLNCSGFNNQDSGLDAQSMN